MTFRPHDQGKNKPTDPAIPEIKPQSDVAPAGDADVPLKPIYPANAAKDEDGDKRADYPQSAQQLEERGPEQPPHPGELPPKTSIAEANAGDKAGVTPAEEDVPDDHPQKKKKKH